MKLIGINRNIYYLINILSVIIGIIYINTNFKKKINKKKILLYNILYFSFSVIFGILYTYILYKKTTLSSYGGLIGVILAAILFEKIIPQNKKIINYTIISLPLVYAITKLACLLAGCCQGFIYNGPLALKYPNINNESYFPIQIIEIILFIILFIYSNKNKNIKNIEFKTLILISLSKYILDYFRLYHINKIITKNQIFSIILLIITFYIYKKTNQND